MSKTKTIAKELGLLFESTKDSFIGNNIIIPKHNLLAKPSYLNLSPSFCKYLSLLPLLPNNKPRWYIPEPNTNLADLEKASQCFIFIGATLSPALIRLVQKNMVFIFEPKRQQTDNFLAQIDEAIFTKKNLFLFSGDPDYLEEPLLHILPNSITDFGVPIFFGCPGMDPNFIDKIRQHLEIFYYRNQLYPYEGQVFTKNNRAITKNFSYIHTKHLTENLELLPQNAAVNQLAGIGKGRNVLLIATGPSLDSQITIIKQLALSCIVIAVNKSCKVLLKNDIIPDIVLLMDSSLKSAAELADLPLDKSILVSYILAGAKQAKPKKILFFGQILEQFGLDNNMIDHLGSVINYGFYLAKFMHCEKIICAGLSLGSKVRIGDGYAVGTAPVAGNLQLWPCPVNLLNNKLLYTSRNFLDVSLWLKADIQKNNLPVINLTQDSLLYGRGISYNPTPQVNEEILPRPLNLTDDNLSEAVIQNIYKTIIKLKEQWTLLKNPEVLFAEGDTLAKQFAPLLKRLDADGTTYLLSTYPDFDLEKFNTDFFGEDLNLCEAATKEYLKYLKIVANTLF